MPPRNKSGAPSAAPARLPSYAMAASRTALSLIVSEASTSEQDEEAGAASGTQSNKGFEAIERSASEALLDVFTRYMRSIGTAARNAAQHAGRSESNAVDMLAALHATGHCTAGDPLSFLEQTPEVAFPCNLSATFPVPREPLSATAVTPVATGADARPAFVPDFLPAFPEKRTYSHTVTHNSRIADGPLAKKKRSKHRQHAQESLLKLREEEAKGEAAARLIGGSATASASSSSATAAAAAATPPVPMPALPAEDEIDAYDAMRETSETGTHAKGRAEGAAALASVPDMLAASFPAVLQSSARLESSGCLASAPFGVPPATASSVRQEAVAQVKKTVDELLKADAAKQKYLTRHAAILGLKHEHTLQDIKEDRGGGGADRDDDE